MVLLTRGRVERQRRSRGREIVAGCQVAVLSGRHFSAFGAGDEGVVLKIDPEAQNCEVLFVGKSQPIPVALRHLHAIEDGGMSGTSIAIEDESVSHESGGCWSALASSIVHGSDEPDSPLRSQCQTDGSPRRAPSMQWGPPQCEEPFSGVADGSQNADRGAGLDHPSFAEQRSAEWRQTSSHWTEPPLHWTGDLAAPGVDQALPHALPENPARRLSRSSLQSNVEVAQWPCASHGQALVSQAPTTLPTINRVSASPTASSQGSDAWYMARIEALERQMATSEEEHRAEVASLRQALDDCVRTIRQVSATGMCQPLQDVAEGAMRVLGVQGVPSPRMPRATSSDGFSRVPSRCRLDATPVAVEVVAPVDTARRARSGSPTIIGTGQRRYLVASPGPGQRVDMGRHTPPSARRMETPLMQQLQMQMPAMPSWGSATAPSMPPQNPSANLFCAQGQSQPKLAPPNLLGSIAGLSTNFSSETSSGLSCPAGLSTGGLWKPGMQPGGSLVAPGTNAQFSWPIQAPSGVVH